MGYHQTYQHMCIGIPEEEEKGEGAEKSFEEIMASSFANLRKGMNIHVQEAQ